MCFLTNSQRRRTIRSAEIKKKPIRTSTETQTPATPSTSRRYSEVNNDIIINLDHVFPSICMYRKDKKVKHTFLVAYYYTIYLFAKAFNRNHRRLWKPVKGLIIDTQYTWTWAECGPFNDIWLRNERWWFLSYWLADSASVKTHYFGQSMFMSLIHFLHLSRVTNVWEAQRLVDLLKSFLYLLASHVFLRHLLPALLEGTAGKTEWRRSR